MPFVAAFVSGDISYDGESYSVLTKSSNQNLAVSSLGLGIRTYNDTTPINVYLSQAVPFNDWGFVFVGQRISSTTYDAAASFNGPVPTDQYYEISTDTGSLLFGQSVGIAVTADNVTDRTPSYGAYVGTFSSRENSAIFFVDGALKKETTQPSVSASLNSITVGSRSGESNRCWRGVSPLIVVLKKYDRIIAQRLSENPWQIFKPRKRVLYFDVSSSFPVLSSLSVSNITSSGGRLTAN